MDHEAATHLHATERYLLDDLSLAEREEFEEHYFICPECAEDVRLAMEFRANARAVFRAKKFAAEPKPRRAWLAWLRPALVLSAALNVALLVGFGLQSTRSGRLAEPGFFPSFFVAGTARSEGTIRDVPRGTRLVGFYFDLFDQERGYHQFAYRVLDNSGKTVKSGVSTPEAPAPRLNLAVPVADLKPGAYTFIFSGVANGQPTELRRTQFRIQQ